MSITDSYLDNVVEAVERIKTTQADAIKAASRACAESIADDGLAFTFGTGHGSFAAASECFPPAGTPVYGFRPIVRVRDRLLLHCTCWGTRARTSTASCTRSRATATLILRAHRLASRTRSSSSAALGHQSRDPWTWR